MSNTENRSAGKGDKYRPVNKSKYDTNYDEINWPSRKKVKTDKEDKDSINDK